MNYTILHSDLKQNHKKLNIDLKIKLFPLEREEKVRLIAVFSTPKEDRRILCQSNLVWNHHLEAILTTNIILSLPFVFFREISEKVRLHFELEQTYQTTKLNLTFVFDSKLFLADKKTLSSLQVRQNQLAFVGCTLLLPALLFDGFLASKGFKPLDTGENTVKTGKKAIFFHANTMVKRACGYSYSPREWKTSYLRRCYEAACKRPVRKNQVLFLSERRLEKNSNLDLVYCQLKKENNLLIELYVNPRTIDKLGFSEIREIAAKIAQSHLVVLEDFYPQIHSLTLRPETKLVQLWHACGAFKTFGFSRLGKIGGPSQSSPNHRSYDYSFVSSKALCPIYAEAFGISTHCVKPLGVPRTDLFFDETYKKTTVERLYKTYPNLQHKKIILFAPTFRGYGNKDAYYPADRFCVDSYLEALPDNCVLLLKHHPFVKTRFIYDKKWEHSVIDFSNSLENINDLLFVTSLLITDYSSVIFEASLLNIPMLFYVFDKKDYLKERDIYYDFDCFLPGPAVETEKELASVSLKLLSQEVRDIKYDMFKKQHLDALDGQSTLRIVNFLKNLL